MTTAIQSTTKQPIVQLWTEGSAKEFAVRLSTDEVGIFRAASNLNAEYNYLALEIQIGKMSTNGWGFMLEFLSDSWLANIKSVSNGGSDPGLSREGILSLKKTNPVAQVVSVQDNPVLAKARKAGDKRRRPHIQCNFCRLRYFDDNERMAHEKMWHPIKSQNIIASEKQRRSERIASTIS